MLGRGAAQHNRQHFGVASAAQRELPATIGEHAPAPSGRRVDCGCKHSLAPRTPQQHDCCAVVPSLMLRFNHHRLCGFVAARKGFQAAHHIFGSNSVDPWLHMLLEQMSDEKTSGPSIQPEIAYMVYPLEVVPRLQREGLAIRTEAHTNRVPRSQRGGEVIEPLVRTTRCPSCFFSKAHCLRHSQQWLVCNNNSEPTTGVGRIDALLLDLSSHHSHRSVFCCG